MRYTCGGARRCTPVVGLSARVRPSLTILADLPIGLVPIMLGRLGCRCRGFLILVEAEEEEKEEGVSLPEKNHIKKGKKAPVAAP